MAVSRRLRNALCIWLMQVLRRLPGVTDANYRMLMDGVKCLADLAVSLNAAVVIISHTAIRCPLLHLLQSLGQTTWLQNGSDMQ